MHYTLENFINYCDDYQVANESAIGDIKKTVKPLKKQIQDLRIKIREADGKPNEQVKYYKEALSIVNDVESKVKAIEVSKFEENIRLAGTFITALLPFVLEISYLAKSGKGSEKPDAKFLARLAGETAFATAIATKSSIDLTTKKDTLSFIEKEKRNISMVIRYLESLPSSANESFIDKIKQRMNDKKERKQKIKDANKYQNEMITKAKEKQFNDAIPYIKKITSEIHGKLKSLVKSKKLNVEISDLYFENNGYEANAYFSYDVSTGEEADIIYEFIDKSLQKYKDLLDEYGIREYIDEGFNLYVSR